MKKQKRRTVFWLILATLLVVILITGLLIYNEYQNIKAVRQLEVELADARVTSLRLTSMTLSFTLQIHNPNDREVDVGKIYAIISANEVPLAELEVPQMKMLPQQTIEREFSLDMSYFDLGAAILQAIKDGEVYWSARGEYLMYLPFGIKYPFGFEVSSRTTA